MTLSHLSLPPRTLSLYLSTLRFPGQNPYTDKELKRSYRKLARSYHPDKAKQNGVQNGVRPSP
eukprot:CAMPEP_0182471454 /NCGR_PEP_ID=MMETSP1319-20130603/20370_1 /TAXON_ID=172717 /ORGANISM="Bolidomonas pacifica, Strain RCC208" /LENGTH=62 /DNA_ID=CAMNT_0024672007 /DNA_START=297 /DNA_END=482 /DNA_ORIENTATION=-